MDIRAYLNRVCDMSDAGSKNVGIYLSDVTKGKKMKGGNEFTVVTVSQDFSLLDISEGVRCFVVLVKADEDNQILGRKP